MPYTPPAPGPSRAYSIRARLDDVQDTVKSSIETPVFVDNAVLHAEYVRDDDATSGRVQRVKPPTQSDFQMTHGRRYRFVEEQSTIRLTHADKAGIDSEGQVFFENGRLQTGDQPPLLTFAELEPVNRLRAKSVESATQGSRLVLQNMKGRTLADVEFSDETHVRLGQTVGVGYRTTDLIQRLFTDKLHGLNSVSVGFTFAGPRAGSVTSYRGADIARHSMSFLSQNFRGVHIPTALRFIARHDGYALFYDRWGNFLYTPRVFAHTDRVVGQSQGMGGAESDPIVDVANRLVVTGARRANNDSIVITVDDAELQKRHGHVKQEEVIDPTATTERKARRSANQLLRQNRKAQGTFKSKKHVKSWDLSAGEIVEYQNPVDKQIERVAILEAFHSLKSHTSTFQFAAYQQGLEGVLQAFGEGQELLQEESQTDRTLQIQTKEVSGIGRARLNVRMLAGVRHVLGGKARTNSAVTVAPVITLNNTAPDVHAGFLLGHRHIAAATGGTTYRTNANARVRGALGGANGSPYTTATTLIGATLTVGSTAGFPQTGLIEISIHDGDTGEACQHEATVASATTFTLSGAPTPRTGVIPAVIAGTVVRLLRSRSHEMGTAKGVAKRFRRW